MGFGIEQSVRLLAVTVLVCWEFIADAHWMRKEYKAKAAHYNITRYIPSRAFPWIWGFVKACTTASVFLYMEWTLSTAEDWPYLAVFVLIFVNLVLSKFWTPLFFGAHQHGAALVIALVLCASAWAVFGIAISAINVNANFYLGPALLWLPYALWLTTALLINVQWVVAISHHRRKGRLPYVSETKDEDA